MRNFRDSRPKYAPVKVGDEFDVKIEAIGEKGDGIAKKDGFVLFVPNTKQGDEVTIRVSRVLRKVGFAEVVEGSGEKSAETKKASKKETDEEEEPEETEDSEESLEEQEQELEDTEDFGEDKN